MGDDSWTKFYSQTLHNYVKNVISPAIMAKKGNLRNLLEEYLKQWQDYVILTYTLGKIFAPCNRYLTGEDVGLYQLSVDAFRKSFYGEYQAPLRNIILDEIEKDRKEEKVDKQFLKETIKEIFINMGYVNNIQIKKEKDTLFLTGKKTMEVYERDFEKYFLQETGKFYEQESNSWK